MSSRAKFQAILLSGLLVFVAIIVLSEMRPPPFRTRGTRPEAFNHLKQLCLAFHQHQDMYGRLPPPWSSSPAGRPLLSWRVLVLPCLEEEGLYREFQLDEPWNSPRNLALLPRMPKVFSPPKWREEHAPAGFTYFQVIVGPGAAFEAGKQMHLPNDFPDGVSWTIFIAEATDAVPWTAPHDLVFVPDGSLPRFGGNRKGGAFLVAMGDGSVRSVIQDLTEPTLRSAITRNGKDKLGADWD